MNACTNCGECVDTGCMCPAKVAKSKPVDGGNVWFVDPDPVRLTTCESIAIYGFITIASIASIALMAGATGWIYQYFFN